MTEHIGFYIYSFHHDDDLRGWIPLDSFEAPCYNEADDSKPLTSLFKRSLISAFMAAGWEGDGDLGGVLVPPFLRVDGCINNMWFPVYHVKQSNNGTSWIASEFPLGFDGEFSMVWERGGDKLRTDHLRRVAEGMLRP